MKIIIVRHGQTEESEKGFFQGTMPGALSKQGLVDSQKLAERLKSERLDLIISSDLKRASDTAKIIAQYHPGTKLVLTPELRERDYGIFTGKLRSVVDKKHPSVETKEAMYQRALKIIELIKKRSSIKNLVIVGHGSINKVLIAALLGKGVSYTKELKLMQTSSVSIVHYSESSRELITFSSIGHLNSV